MITVEQHVVPAATDRPGPALGGAPWGPPDVTPVAAPTGRGERVALGVLLCATALLYLWGLGASGWANSYYSAAAQAGSESWSAWFYGASDAAGSITVDKPPASLWVMGLSVRLFGLSSWSILVPQALMGVATVALVHATVRRISSSWAALLAGAAMATTPVAALMFRFNNPDALLVVLMTAAAWAVLRGIDDGRRRWIVVAGALLGAGFLTKQLQVLLVVPPLALAHLVAASGGRRRRITDLALGGGAMVVAAGWWLAIVELVPDDLRPYIGGSQGNSILELTLGYNGLGRITGDETGSVGGGTGRWGDTGITRLVDGVIGGQIAWLLPAAAIAIVAGSWVTRRAPRTDPTRAALVVWTGWLLLTALVFSFMEGIFHEYYTVALAPAIAALVGIGADLLWRHRGSAAATASLAAMVATTAVWSASLLGRAPDWNPWLGPVVLIGGLAASLAIVAGRWLSPRLLVTAGIVAAVAGLAGPTAWAVQTATRPQSGSIATAGPTVAGGQGPGGRPNGPLPGGAPNGGVPGRVPGGAMPGPLPGRAGTPTAPGAAGGLLAGSEPSEDVVELLAVDADDYTWVAAAVGSNRASGFQLATEQPVMAVGGFNGSDPSPTLDQFQQYVIDGEIHWFVDGGGFGRSMDGSDESAAIAAWVADTFTSVTVDGVVLYDLTAPA